MIKAKKIYLLVIFAISAAVAIYYFGILYIELVVFALTAIIMSLLTFYAFVRGTIALATSSRLLTHYRFHLDVLNGDATISEKTGFVTPLLTTLKQQIEGLEKQEQCLRSKQINFPRCLKNNEHDT